MTAKTRIITSAILSALILSASVAPLPKKVAATSIVASAESYNELSEYEVDKYLDDLYRYIDRYGYIGYNINPKNDIQVNGIIGAQSLMNFIADDDDDILSVDAKFGEASQKRLREIQADANVNVDGCLGWESYYLIKTKAEEKLIGDGSYVEAPTSVAISSNNSVEITANIYGANLRKFEVYRTGACDIEIVSTKGSVATGATVVIKLYNVNLNEGEVALVYRLTTRKGTYEVKVPVTNLISPGSIHTYQYDFDSRSACTLAACADVLKARCILDGKSPDKISNSKMWNKAWVVGAGTKLDYTIDGMRMKAYNMEKKSGLNSQTNAEKITTVKKLLEEHEEGIVLYFWDSRGNQHAVYANFVNDEIKIIDPAIKKAKYISLSESANSVCHDIKNLKQIWYIN